MTDAHVNVQVVGPEAQLVINVKPASLAGPKGDSGVYVGEEEPTDPSVMVWVDTDGDPDEGGGGGDTPGKDGEDGGYYVPAVSAEGELSWQASKNDMPGVPNANVRGPEGPAGNDGFSPVVEVFEISGGHRVEITDANGVKAFEVADGRDGGGGGGGTGADGEDGGYYVPTVTDDGELRWNASKVGMPTVASANIRGPEGPEGKPGSAGSPGADGKDGKTPEKGVDYYTETDKAEMVQAVLAALPIAEEASF